MNSTALRRLVVAGMFLLLCLPLGITMSQTAAGASGPAHDTDLYETYFRKADQHLGKFEFEESIKDCKEALKYRPGDFLIRAIMCLDYYEVAEAMDIKQPGVKDKKMQIYETMRGLAEEGIALAPDKGECYFMRGLANARIATTKGIFSELFTAKQIEQDWLIAVNRKSDYTTPNGENLQASSCVALGVYYRLCPSFFLIRWIFGISGDFDKSVSYCRKAYELDSTRIEIVKEYGVALVTHGLDSDNKEEIEKGKEFLRKVATLPIRLHTDHIDIAHSTMLLNDISLCPGYSRDEEQDVSEASYEKMNKN